MVYAISHFGVPVFFVVSGYFFLDRNGNLTVTRLLSKIKHIGFLLLLHIGLYVLYEIILKVTAGEIFIIVLHNLRNYFNIRVFLKAVILGTGIMGGGEWFLVSLIEAYIVIGLALQIKEIRELVVKYSHLVATVLLLIHIPVRLYAIKTGIKSIGGISLLESYSVRNTWFDAIPFLLMGIAIRKYPVKISHPLVISVFAMLMSVGECFFQKKMLKPQVVYSVLYIGTVIAVICTFIWALKSEGKSNVFSVIGHKYSMLIFFLHPIAGQFLQNMLYKNLITKNGIGIQCLVSCSIMLMTTMVAVVVDRCVQTLKNLKY